MKRVNYHLREDQIKALRELARDRDITVAELIRRGIDAMLDKKLSKDEIDLLFNDKA